MTVLHSIMPNIADLSEEDRTKALQRTADILRKLDNVRKNLELPPELLPVVVEIHAQVVQSMIAEALQSERESHTRRLPLTMKSDVMLTRDHGKQPVFVRPQFIAFRAEEITIQGERSHWLVHDVQVGNTKQFLGKLEPISGTEFGPGGMCEKLKFETCQTAMDLILWVEYVGPMDDGEFFEAIIVGTSVSY